MKAKLFIVALFFLPSFAFAATIEISSNNYSIGDTLTIDIVGTCDEGEVSLINTTTNTYANGDTCIDNSQYNILLDQNFLDNMGAGSYAILLTDFFDGGSNPCYDYLSCLSLFPSPIATFNFEFVPQTGINAIINSGQTAYSSTIGGSVSQDVSYVGDNFIKLWLGSAMAVLAGVVNWAVAIIIIGIIVYFAYRGFRFFRT